MGLMYIFPVSVDEIDRASVITSKDGSQKTLSLKTYGLPMIFWGYLAASLVVIFSMWLASKATIDKLMSYDDSTMILLGLLVKGTLILTPIILLSLFFYEKEIQKNCHELKLIYKVFFIPFWMKKITLDSDDAFSVDHFMDSPNMAKIYNKEELKGFENKGYFELHAYSGGRKIHIDRHTRKADLLKIKDLLGQF